MYGGTSQQVKDARGDVERMYYIWRGFTKATQAKHAAAHAAHSRRKHLDRC